MNALKNFIEIFNESFDEFYEALDKNLFKIITLDTFTKQQITEDLINIIQDDVSALIKGDPAARKNRTNCFDHSNSGEQHAKEDIKYVLTSYKSLNAVIMYRVAHLIHKYCDDFMSNSENDQSEVEGVKLFLQAQARKLSDNTKASTGVEIHPAAKIGKRFVVDHGYGTVIGETCEIGDDCYILQGVTLGATGVKDNDTGRRHPKLGNKVEIAGFARVFGPINIGDETKIFGYAVIDRHIPAKREVSIVNQLQLILPKSYPISIYGLYPKGEGIEIIGRNLDYCKDVELLNSEGILLESILEITERSNNIITISINNFERIIDDPKLKHYIISINLIEGNILLVNSVGWLDFIKTKK
jgi:serine O-acetyltransferase